MADRFWSTAGSACTKIYWSIWIWDAHSADWMFVYKKVFFFVWKKQLRVVYNKYTQTEYVYKFTYTQPLKKYVWINSELRLRYILYSKMYIFLYTLYTIYIRKIIYKKKNFRSHTIYWKHLFLYESIYSERYLFYKKSEL